MYALLFPFVIISHLYCSLSLLSHSTIVLSHTIRSTGLLALLSFLLLFYLLIVLTYYTALDRHSIHSNTFLYNDSPSRVSCLSWQSTRSFGSFLWALLRHLFLSQRQSLPLSITCRGDGSPLISIALGLADRSLVFSHINTVAEMAQQNIPLSHGQGYHSYRSIIDRWHKSIHIA